MSAIHVREAADTDAPSIAEISRSALATLRQTYRPTERAIAHANSLPPRQRMVAAMDGGIVGTVQYYREDNRIHLMGLFVHDTARRKGVARALVEHLAELARTSGMRRLSLYTIRETGNVAIFERMGFLAVSEAVDRFAESDRHAVLQEVYMERVL